MSKLKSWLRKSWNSVRKAQLEVHEREISEHFDWMQASLLVNGSTAPLVRQCGAYPGTKVSNLFQSQTQLKRCTLPKCLLERILCTFQSHPQKYSIMVIKYIHGWLPTGQCRKLIHNGDLSYPNCSLKETDEHLIICKHNKTEYTRNMYYLTTMRSKMNTSEVGKDTISQIRLD